MAAKSKTASFPNRKRSSPKPAAPTSGWFQALYESQTGRTIIAEMMVAAAGAAAAVLLSKKGRGASAAVVDAGRAAVGTVKKSGRRAASAAYVAIGSVVEGADQISAAAAKATGLQHEPTQHELAEKALEMRGRKDAPSRPKNEIPSRTQVATPHLPPINSRVGRG